MHIVMLTNAVAPDKLGGLERYVRELSSALAASGAIVTIVAKKASRHALLDEQGDDGVRILRFKVPDKRDPTFALRYPIVVQRAVAKALSAISGPSIVHSHFPVPALAPFLQRRPYVHTCHAPVYKELLSERQGSYLLPAPVQSVAVRGLKAVERSVLTRAEQLIVLSDYVRREIAVLDSRTAARARRIAGGIDVDRFRPPQSGADPSRGLSREDVLWTGNASPLLVVARRLVPRTGVVQLVQAMPAILDANKRAKLVIAGEGPLRHEVGSEIKRLGVADAVRLVGRVSDEALVSWYQRADIAVTPTQELEGFGLATAEALSCGTPAAVTPAGANGEVAGLLSPKMVADDCSPAGIAGVVNRLTGDPGLLEMLAAGARGAVLALSWRQVAEAHMDMYRCLSSQQADRQ